MAGQNANSTKQQKLDALNALIEQKMREKASSASTAQAGVRAASIRPSSNSTNIMAAKRLLIQKRQKLAAAKRQRMLSQQRSVSPGMSSMTSMSSSSVHPPPAQPQRASSTPPIHRSNIRTQHQQYASHVPPTASTFSAAALASAAPPPPVCKFFLQGKCFRGVHCHFSHQKPTPCKFCQKPLPVDPAQRVQHAERCLENKKVALEQKASASLKCAICKKPVLSEKGAKFGILTQCSHIFCFTCIRDYKPKKGAQSQTQQSKSNPLQKTCPMCGKQSELILPLDRMVINPTRKVKFVATYKSRLKEIRCRRFNFGNGQCPFGDKCFYSHRTSKDGSAETADGANGHPDGTSSGAPSAQSYKWGRGDPRRLKKRQLQRSQKEREARATKRSKTAAAAFSTSAASSSKTPIEILSDDEEEDIADYGDDTRDDDLFNASDDEDRIELDEQYFDPQAEERRSTFSRAGLGYDITKASDYNADPLHHRFQYESTESTSLLAAASADDDCVHLPPASSRFDWLYYADGNPFTRGEASAANASSDRDGSRMSDVDSDDNDSDGDSPMDAASPRRSHSDLVRAIGSSKDNAIDFTDKETTFLPLVGQPRTITTGVTNAPLIRFVHGSRERFNFTNQHSGSSSGASRTDGVVSEASDDAKFVDVYDDDEMKELPSPDHARDRRSRAMPFRSGFAAPSTSFGASDSGGGSAATDVTSDQWAGSFGSFEQHTRGIGIKLLTRMGFRGRLGKHGQGEITPVAITLATSRNVARNPGYS